MKLLKQQADRGLLTEIERGGNPSAIAIEHFTCKGSASKRRIRLPRASSLYDCCIRQHVLCTLSKTIVTQRLSFADRMTFALGNAIHYHFQNTNDAFKDNRWGRWRCRSCGYRLSFGPPPKRDCPACGASQKAFVYSEILMKAPKPYYGTGHPDMFHKIHSRLRVNELKSLNGAEFETMQVPFISHVWQIHFYMWAGSECWDMPVPVDFDVGYITYFSKQTFRKILPVKMFVVQREDKIIDQIKNKLGAFRLGVSKQGKVPAPIKECEKKKWTGYKAQNCPVHKRCITIWQKEK